jgi:hypothetical protein
LGGIGEPPSPTPSGDWRNHSLSRNSSGTSDGRSIRKIAAAETFWPTLDDFPAVTRTTPPVGTRPQGAWAARTPNNDLQ